MQLNDHERRELAAEGQRRGLPFSSTLRTLAKERLSEIRDEQQLARARRWQLARIRSLADRVARGNEAEVTRAEIDAIFERAIRSAREGKRQAQR